MLTRAIDWIATLSIDPRAEIRRGTIAVFSELQSAHTSQRTLHELYFHQHDDKKLLEERVRGAMSDVGERITRVAVNPSGGVIQKRHNIATELRSISALVEGKGLRFWPCSGVFHSPFHSTAAFRKDRTDQSSIARSSEHRILCCR